MFYDDGLPDNVMQPSSDTIARTWIHYDPDTGRLYDADIEVDTKDYRFSVNGKKGLDLQAVLTHESGHFLGLNHSGNHDATMRPGYDDPLGRPGASFVVLSKDDKNAICVAYPPDRKVEGKCNGLPPHGFASACADAQVQSCAYAPEATTGAAPALAAAAAALAAAWRRRARKEVSSPSAS
jgi:hypothetical protein